jgi:hypothetical protein
VNGCHETRQHADRVSQTARKGTEAVPVTARGDPWGWETSRLPHFLDNRLTDTEVVPATERGGPCSCETSRLPHFLDNQLTDGLEVGSFMRQATAFYSYGRSLVLISVRG